MKWIVGMVVVLLLAFVMPASAEIAAWGLGGPAASEVLAARLGYVRDNIEVGGTAYWYEKPEAPPQVYGCYGIYHFPDLIDVNTPIGLDFLPERLNASAYIGTQITIGDDEHRGFVGLVAGTVIQKVIVIEGQWNSFSDSIEDAFGPDEMRVMVGMRWQF